LEAWIVEKQNTESVQQQNLEAKWAPTLQNSASSQQVQQAYEELQRARLGEESALSPLPKLSSFDLVFVKQVGTGKTALEVGCGDDGLAFELARQGNTVIATDTSEFVLERAQSRLSQELDLELRFEHGDARTLDFEDKSFDSVVSRNLVEHLSVTDSRRHLQEVWRVLKSTGCAGRQRR